MTLHKPLWAQNETYSAMNDRGLVGALFGDLGLVVNGLAVTQRGAGANMSVDIAPGDVVLPGPLRPYLAYSDAVENRAIAAAPAAGTSRRDLVYAEVVDPQAMGSGAAVGWDIKVLAGTAVAGTPAVPATPAWSTPLASVLVTDTTTSVLTSAVRDARQRRSVLGFPNKKVVHTSTTGAASTTSTVARVWPPSPNQLTTSFTKLSSSTDLVFSVNCTAFEMGANTAGTFNFFVRVDAADFLVHQSAINADQAGDRGMFSGERQASGIAAGTYTCTLCVSVSFAAGFGMEIKSGDYLSFSVEEVAPA